MAVNSFFARANKAQKITLPLLKEGNMIQDTLWDQGWILWYFVFSALDEQILWKLDVFLSWFMCSVSHFAA